MKRILYIMSALLLVALASCSKEEMVGPESPDSRQVTVEAVADYAMADGSALAQTRATATVDRYVIEVYSDDTHSTAANVFSDGTNKASNATGSFAMTLTKETSYYCLLWADTKANGAEAYTVTDLKNVSLITGKNPTEAFHGTLTLDGNSTTYSVSLKRAVANIVLKETGTLAAGTLTVKCQQPTGFNVSTATTVGTPSLRTESLTVEAASGTAANPATLNPTSPIFVLAPATSAGALTFTFGYEAEAEFDVTGAKVQANYNTNIKGHFTTAVEDNTYAVGDVYPKTGTAIGVVFWLDNTDAGYVAASGSDPAKGVKGKIVSLDEPIADWNGGTNIEGGLNWSTESVSTGATSSTDGAANTAKIKALTSYSATTYPAFAWCIAKGTGWYLPARHELGTLYANKVAVNAGLTTASGTTIDAYNRYYYYCSTELTTASVRTVSFSNGSAGLGSKGGNARVRAVSAF